MSVNNELTIMAKDVATAWIQKHASTRFCLTVFFPSYDQAVKARKIARFAVGSGECMNPRIPRIASSKTVEGLDSIMIISNDENGMTAFRDYMTKLGFEVGWGW